jgi:hypothetical protein
VRRLVTPIRLAVRLVGQQAQLWGRSPQVVEEG